MSVWFLVATAIVMQMSSEVEGRIPRQFYKKCPRGFQLVFDRQSRKLSCDCKQNHLYWPENGICYEEFTQGPCSAGNRLVLNSTSRLPYCQCPAFWSRYQDGTCHEDYTRGPCSDGQLFVYDHSTNSGVCRCDSTMVMHYFPATGRCYPKYSQGPCNDGHIIKFDYRSLSPHCECRDGHEKWSDGHCYRLNTIGPCRSSKCKGTPCFTRNLQSLRTECSCLDSSVSVEAGSCYEPYLQGPCQSGHWLVPLRKSSRHAIAASRRALSAATTPSTSSSTSTLTSSVAISDIEGHDKTGVEFACQPKKHCTRFDNWFYWPATERCYRQFSRGPCSVGQLFFMDVETGRAVCRCQKQWRAYYWPEDGRCYEQHSVGPCARGMFFGFNFTADRAACHCFKSHVYNESDGTCVEKFTRGACPYGQLVTEDSGGRLACACSSSMTSHYWSRDGLCHEHFKQGPCSSGETFRIDLRGGDPDCVVWQG